MSTESPFRYGFRCDPMEWVEKDRSFHAARVRKVIFGKPLDGDQELIDAEIEKALAKQEPSGRIGDTGSGLLHLLILGLAHDRPEVKRAVDYMVQNDVKDGTLGVYGTHALCILGGEEHAALRDRSLAKTADECRKGNRGGCPWTPVVHLKALWAGRQYVDVDDAIANDMGWIAEGMNEVCALSFKDPGGFVGLAGEATNEFGRKIAQKAIPMLLRSQQEDGGWGGRSFEVFRLLVAYGLLEPLRALPALPRDWREVRSIPAPEGVGLLTWLNGNLWVCNAETHEAVAVSPADGTVVKRVPLPEEAKALDGIGAWDDCLAVSAGSRFHYDPYKEECDIHAGTLYQVDAETGKVRRQIGLRDRMSMSKGPAMVDGRMWVADDFDWVAVSFDPDNPDDHHMHLLGASVESGQFAPADDGVWHLSNSPCLVKSVKDSQPVTLSDETAGELRNATILDWGEKPFGDATGGIAFDGENLWALDNKAERICVIEKTESGKEIAAALSPGRE